MEAPSRTSPFLQWALCRILQLSIIVQLLQMDVVPKFTEWSKQGKLGRRKLAQFTRYFTIVLALVQAIGMSYGFTDDQIAAYQKSEYRHVYHPLRLS